MVADPLKIKLAPFDKAVKACETLTGQAKIDCLRKAALMRKGV